MREACANRAGLALDVHGWRAARAIERPETVLPQYDIVFAKGRAALEAVAVGCAVIVCDAFGVGPMITMQNAMELRSLKGDYLRLYSPMSVDALTRQINSYNPPDAAAVSNLARSIVGMEPVVAALTIAYQKIVDEFAAAPTGADVESRAASDYLARLNSQVKEQALLYDGVYKEMSAARVELARERNSAAIRFRSRLLGLPVIGRWLHEQSIKSKP